MDLRHYEAVAKIALLDLCHAPPRAAESPNQHWAVIGWPSKGQCSIQCARQSICVVDKMHGGVQDMRRESI